MKNIHQHQAKGTELYMLLYTIENFYALENFFNCTFIFSQKQKIRRCKALSDAQISYYDIGIMKYGQSCLLPIPAVPEKSAGYNQVSATQKFLDNLTGSKLCVFQKIFVCFRQFIQTIQFHDLVPVKLCETFNSGNLRNS